MAVLITYKWNFIKYPYEGNTTCVFMSDQTMAVLQTSLHNYFDLAYLGAYALLVYLSEDIHVNCCWTLDLFTLLYVNRKF